MTEHGVLIATCGRCASALPARGAKCDTCGTPRIPARAELVTTDGSVAALNGTQPAQPRDQWFAFTVDLAPVVLGIVGTLIWSLTGGGATAALLGAVGVALVVVIHLAMLTARGRSLGRFIWRLRTVDDLTGLPPRLLDAAGVLVGRGTGTATVSLRGGRDPLEPTVAAISAGTLRNSVAGTAPAAVTPSAPQTGEGAAAVAIVLDSGQRLVIERSLVIGRNPRSDGSHPVHVWPDLSRSISKRHALLEWSGTELWVTDLDSEHGTASISPTGQRQELEPGRRTAVRVGSRVQFGERSLLVTEAVQR